MSAHRERLPISASMEAVRLFTQRWWTAISLWTVDFFACWKLHENIASGIQPEKHKTHQAWCGFNPQKNSSVTPSSTLEKIKSSNWGPTLKNRFPRKQQVQPANQMGPLPHLKNEWSLPTNGGSNYQQFKWFKWRFAIPKSGLLQPKRRFTKKHACRYPTRVWQPSWIWSHEVGPHPWARMSWNLLCILPVPNQLKTLERLCLPLPFPCCIPA